MCQILPNAKLSKAIFDAKSILIDEITMATNIALDAIEQCCHDIMGNTKPFGDKTILIGGDFRQCLPVIRKASKCQILTTTVKSSKTWSLFTQLKLNINIRTLKVKYCAKTIIIVASRA